LAVRPVDVNPPSVVAAANGLRVTPLAIRANLHPASAAASKVGDQPQAPLVRSSKSSLNVPSAASNNGCSVVAEKRADHDDGEDAADESETGAIPQYVLDAMPTTLAFENKHYTRKYRPRLSKCGTFWSAYYNCKHFRKL
jgi:hypothetical protein